MYKLGKILKIDNMDFGFIEFDPDYDSGFLTTYSLKDREKVYFYISSKDFNDLYSNSKDVLSKETIDFALNEKKRIDSILEQIKPYMIFIGDDNEEYVFLKCGDSKIYFCKDELYFCDKPDFIKSLTDNFDTSYVNMTRPEIFKSYYNKLSNERKVRRAINYIRLLLQDKIHNSEILQIGNIVKARSHSEELNVDYELIGLQIKLKSDFINKNKPNIKVVFSPIYINIFGDSCPSSLNELFKGDDFNVPQTYVNNLGNKIIIEEILIPKEDLQDIEFQF